MEEKTNNVIEGQPATPHADSPKNEQNQVSVVANNDLHVVQRASNDIANINLFDAKETAAAEVFFKRIMRSSKGGLTSIEDGFATIMRAKDLNVPFSTALEHVHVINGKTGVDIHIIKALLLRAGVTWGEPFMDYAPLYEYTDGFNVYNDDALPIYAVRCKSAAEATERANADKEKNIDEHVYLYPVRYYQDFNGSVYKEYQLNGSFAVVANKSQIAKAAADKKIPICRIPNKPIDYVTKYRLHRTIAGKEVTSVGSFSYSEAVAAGMFDKDTYKKYPKILIGHRAFTYAARDIASDVLLGAYETSELKIMNGVDITDNDIAV
jgi:hypothetical protein